MPDESLAAYWLLHLPTGNVLDEQPTREGAQEVLDEFLATDPGADPEEFRVVECPQ